MNVITFACAIVVAGTGIFEPLGDSGWKLEKSVTVETAKPYGAGFAREGAELVCHAYDMTKGAAAHWLVELNQRDAEAVRFTAEGRSVSVTSGDAMRIYIDVLYMDGSFDYGVSAVYRADPKAGWQKRQVVLDGGRPIKHVSIYTMVRGAVGEAHFRNPKLEVMKGVGCVARLDGVALKSAPTLKQAEFLLRDAAAGTGYVPFVEGSALGVTLSETHDFKGGARHYHVKLAGSAAARDRALTLVFAVPLPAGALTWCKDPRTNIPIDAGMNECNIVSTVPYGRGAISKWPYIAATAGDRGIGIAVDPLAPAVYRCALNAKLRLVYIAFDIALAAEKNDAAMGFAVFPFEASQGGRGAWAGWARAYPFATRNRMTKWGLWTVSVPPYKIENFEDFGFMYMEGDEGQWQWYDDHGIYCFHYTEPSSWWMSCVGADGALPSYDECVARAEELAAQGDARALSWKVCAAKNEYGECVGHIQSQAWCKSGTMWSLNSAPGIKSAHSDYNVKLSEKSFADRYGGHTFPEGCDGEYIDSSEMGFSIGGDYDRAHFSAMATPLCWGGEKMKPCVSGAMVSFEYARSVQARLDKRGRFTIGNSTPYRTSMIVPFLDIPGTEVDWHRNNTWRPSSHEDLLYKRAIAGKKPYCFLFNTNYENLDHATVEKYMQRTLAYGMFPGFFSDNGYTDCYFSFPKYYNRDRDLFKKYVPLTCEIAAAGWEPVTTLAACPFKDVFVEQFGTRYVTVFNASTTQRKTVPITSAKAKATERVTGVAIVFKKGMALLEMPPESARLLDFGEE